MDSVEWSAPDEQGNQACPRHPHAAPFKAAHGGCPDCDSDPADRARDRQGPGETLLIDARSRGLLDALGVEVLVTKGWQRDEARADRCIARAEQLYDTGDPDDLDRAIKLEGAAAKWADTAMKAAKIVNAGVSLREELASEERAARDLIRAKGEAG